MPSVARDATRANAEITSWLTIDCRCVFVAVVVDDEGASAEVRMLLVLAEGAALSVCCNSAGKTRGNQKSQMATNSSVNWAYTAPLVTNCFLRRKDVATNEQKQFDQTVRFTTYLVKHRLLPPARPRMTQTICSSASRWRLASRHQSWIARRETTTAVDLPVVSKAERCEDVARAVHDRQQELPQRVDVRGAVNHFSRR